MQRVEFTVKYSLVLESVVGTDKDTFTIDLEVGEEVEIPFGFIMFTVESRHPKLFEKYPPGKLDFKLNGKDPQLNTLVQSGDEAWFGVLQN